MEHSGNGQVVPANSPVQLKKFLLLLNAMIEELRGMRKLFLKNSKKNFQEIGQLLFKLFFQEKSFSFDLVARSQKEKRPSNKYLFY